MVSEAAPTRLGSSSYLPPYGPGRDHLPARNTFLGLERFDPTVLGILCESSPSCSRLANADGFYIIRSAWQST
jgi:hypothetical protein